MQLSRQRAAGWTVQAITVGSAKAWLELNQEPIERWPYFWRMVNAMDVEWLKWMGTS